MRKTNFQEKLWRLQSKKGQKKLYKFLNIFFAATMVLNMSFLGVLMPQLSASAVQYVYNADLIVIMNVVGGTATSSDFSITVTGNNVSSPSFAGAAAPGTFVLLDSGDYSVTTSLTNYVISTSTDCTGFMTTGDFNNVCTITGTYQEPVEPTADLSIAKTIDNSTPMSGSEITYTLTVTNNGTDEAFLVRVMDNLPIGLEFVSATSTVGEYATSTGQWNVGSMINGAVASLQIIAKVIAEAGQTITNTATVSSVEGPSDPNQTNNSSSVTFNSQLGVCSGSGTYNVNADFDKGSLINVNHVIGDQLQLSDQVKAFNFIWVAVSTKGTIVKINVDTGDIIGEYRTSPDGNYGDPSRTTVDKDGSVWVGNRQPVIDGTYSAVTHIGLIENNQCEDRNGNGVIDTSIAQNDIKPWTNGSGVRGVETAEDECIVHFTKVSGYDSRHISVDSDNNIWVSGVGSRIFQQIKGGKYNIPNSGTVLRTEGPAEGGYYGGYGGLIDKNGVIWSASNLLRWDTSLPLTGPNGGNWTGFSHGSYGLCIDSHGNVFNTEYGPKVYKHAPDGTLLDTFTHGTGAAQGCVVDKNDDLWIAGSLSGNTVDHLKNNGTFVGSVPVGSGPTGVAVDANGKIWATNYYSGTVSRIDPTLGAIGADAVTKIGAVDFTSVGLGGNPYNYSDMTGSTLSGKAQSGTWTVVHDGEVAGHPWRNITWNADLNGGAIAVTVSTSSDGLTFSAPQTITSGQSLSSLTSRYLKIVVSFERGENGSSPVLYDLTATRECGQAIDQPTPPAPQSSSGGGGSTPWWLLQQQSASATSVATTVIPAVLGETLKPNLKLTKTVNEKTAFAGAKNVKFSLTVENTGNASAFDVKVKDVLPAGLTFDNGSSEKIWNIGELKPGEKKTITYQINISADVSAASYVNTAELTASGLSGISAKATIQVLLPKVLGEKLPNTGFNPIDLLLIISVILTLVISRYALRKRLA